MLIRSAIIRVPSLPPQIERFICVLLWLVLLAAAPMANSPLVFMCQFLPHCEEGGVKFYAAAEGIRVGKPCTNFEPHDLARAWLLAFRSGAALTAGPKQSV